MDNAGTTSILIIDGNEAARVRLGALLGDRHNVILAATTADGLVAFEHEQPACVLVDEELPEMHQYELLKRLTKKGGVVVVTSEAGSPEIEREVFWFGAQDYAVKNRLNREAISRVVLRAIDRGRLIAETRVALHALRDSEQRFKDIASRITEGLWVRNAEGTHYLYVSPTFEKIWGRTLEEMNQIDWRETVHQDDRQRIYEEFLTARTQKREFRVECRIIRPDGEIRRVVDDAFPVIDAEGQLIRQTGIARDVTEERKLEEELRVAQKLESLGQISAGIAHEINTPSQYVSDNISFLEEAAADLTPVLRAYKSLLEASANAGVPPETLSPFEQIAETADLDYVLEELPEALSQCRDGIEQIRKIVLAMKEFSHVSSDKEPIDLNRAIETTVMVARNEWKYVAELNLEFDESLPPVSCVRSAIGQVVLNLVVNAAHAIGDVSDRQGAGTITISTRACNDTVVVRVADSGSGIPAEIREKIFDPFFTTKEVGRGTGQGLAIVYSIVRDQHGGSITVESEPGKGSCFTITLPVGESGVTGKEAAA